MGNIEFFNTLAEKTNGLMNTGRAFTLRFNLYRNIFKDISTKIEIKPTDNILDLGGGCGQITKYLAQKASQVHLADGAQNAIKLAQVRLKDYHNISYSVLDITKLPLPFTEKSFDKVICYSVIQYLNNQSELKALVGELLRITKDNGQILIGDIPLPEKLKVYLAARKKQPIKNFVLNTRYYLRRFITANLIYQRRGINACEASHLYLTKTLIEEVMKNFTSIDYQFLLQSKKLIFANSSEDLLIVKK